MSEWQFQCRVTGVWDGIVEADSKAKAIERAKNELLVEGLFPDGEIEVHKAEDGELPDTETLPGQPDLFRLDKNASRIFVADPFVGSMLTLVIAFIISDFICLGTNSAPRLWL